MFCCLMKPVKLTWAEFLWYNRPFSQIVSVIRHGPLNGHFAFYSLTRRDTEKGRTHMRVPNYITFLPSFLSLHSPPLFFLLLFLLFNSINLNRELCIRSTEFNTSLASAFSRHCTLHSSPRTYQVNSRYSRLHRATCFTMSVMLITWFTLLHHLPHSPHPKCVPPLNPSLWTNFLH